MIASHLNYCILASGYEHSWLNKILKRVIRIAVLSDLNGSLLDQKEYKNPILHCTVLYCIVLL